MIKPTSFHLKTILIIVMVLFAIPAVAKTHSGQVSHEIEKLIEFVRTSDCTFYRNGRWYEAVKAAEHINQKYQYVQKRGLINTAEDFIKYAATKSSFSGKPYIVQCADGEAMQCATWLTTALEQLRESKIKPLIH